jgi:hypothetical protein
MQKSPEYAGIHDYVTRSPGNEIAKKLGVSAF